MSNELSVQEYKQIFDENNYRKNNYEVALFISFLMKKSKLIREIEELTGLKKSQIHSYKKIINSGKTDDLKSIPFRTVIKNCTANQEPKVEEDLVEAIEKLNLNPKPKRSTYGEAHFFEEFEFSSDRSSFRKNYFCPCGMDSAPTKRGQKHVHIPYLDFSTTTFLELKEITEHAEKLNDLGERVKQLEAENKDLRLQNKFLSDALKMSG